MFFVIFRLLQGHKIDHKNVADHDNFNFHSKKEVQLSAAFSQLSIEKSRNFCFHVQAQIELNLNEIAHFRAPLKGLRLIINTSSFDRDSRAAHIKEIQKSFVKKSLKTSVALGTSKQLLTFITLQN